MTTRPRAAANEEKQPEAHITLAEASQLVLLDVKKLRFFRHGAALRLTVGEDCSYLKVSVLYAFPLSEPHRFLSVQDGENNEIGLIVDPADLGVENRELVEEELARRYLMPSVTRIVAAKERFGIVEWMMETDRGACRFITQNLRENVQLPAPGRIILSDVDGNRYDIRNVAGLSRESQELLFRHL